MTTIDKLVANLTNNQYIYILPVENLSINNSFSFGDVSIHPANTINPSNVFRNIIEIDEEQSWIRDGLLNKIFNCTTIIIQDAAYSNYLGNIESNEEIIQKAINKSRVIIDFIRLQFSNINDNKRMTGRVGQLNDGSTLALLIDKNLLLSRIVHTHLYRNVLCSAYGSTMSISIKETSFLNQLTTYNYDISEVGFIAIHALNLFSNAFEGNSSTDKFIEFMRLFEFIAFPSKYEQFKKVRVKIAEHIVQNNNDIERLKTEFIQYTSGENNNGYRTQIIHNGQQLEDILSPNEINALLRKLQLYATKCIQDLLSLYNQPWRKLEEFRESNFKRAQANKENIPHYLSPLSFVVIDFDFITEALKTSIELYQEIYPNKVLSMPSLEDIIYLAHQNLRIQNMHTEHEFIIYTSNDSSSLPDHLHFFKNSYSFIGKVKKLDSSNEKYKEMNQDVEISFRDSPIIDTGTNVTKIGFVVNDDELNKTIIQLIQSKVRSTFFIKDPYQSNIVSTPYVLVGLVCGLLLGLRKDEL